MAKLTAEQQGEKAVLEREFLQLCKQGEIQDGALVKLIRRATTGGIPEGIKGWSAFEENNVRGATEQNVFPGVRALVSGASKRPEGRLALMRILSMAEEGLHYRIVVESIAKSPEVSEAIRRLSDDIDSERESR